MADRETHRSPAIWRCSGCGALVHPADENAPAAWCMRCGAVVRAERDGGGPRSRPRQAARPRLADAGRATTGGRLPSGPNRWSAPPSPGASRPSPAELVEAVAKQWSVPDVVAPDLDILFCGINPGRWSGAVGHHFAHPGNRFWRLLFAAGLTDRLLGPADEKQLLAAGLGVTNLVGRTTTAAADLSVEELREGAARLADTARRWQPVAVAVLGLGAYRIAFGRRQATVGEQPEVLGPAAMWVLPNPSGLQGHYRFEDMVGLLRQLQASVDRRRQGSGDRRRWRDGSAARRPRSPKAR